MAWQNPKTNWAAADGVRAADFNRIEGNILELYNVVELRNTRTLFVSPSGDDATGDGSASTPFKTIGKALEVMPKNLAGKTAMISIEAGTYAESVAVSGFDGPIELTGSSGDLVNVNGFRVDGCTCVLSNITIVSSTPVYVMSGARLVGDGNLSITGGSTGINVSYGSHVSVNTLLCNGATGYAINVSRNSSLHAKTLDGAFNRNGISCDGGVVRYDSMPMGVTGARTLTIGGGRIYSGAQSNMPSY